MLSLKQKRKLKKLKDKPKKPKNEDIDHLVHPARLLRLRPHRLLVALRVHLDLVHLRQTIRKILIK